MFGRYETTITMPGPEPSDSIDKILRLVKSQQGGFATAPEIAPQMSVDEKQTRNRLDKLVDKGYLRFRRVGSTKVYWLSDDGERKLASVS